jgi:hypothetical protein
MKLSWNQEYEDDNDLIINCHAYTNSHVKKTHDALQKIPFLL